MPPRSTAVRFPCRGGRSPAVLAALLLLIAVESVVLHLWIAPSSPLGAWTLTALSVLTGGWLLGDYRALGDAALTVTDETVVLDIGWRARSAMPRTSLARLAHASWRDIPDGNADGYVNLAKPAEPDVLITCDPPAVLRLFGVVDRPVRLIGLHVDDPDALMLLMQAPRTT